MILTKFSFDSTLEIPPYNPVIIDRIDLMPLNLLVGKNASGKTTVSDSIGSLVQMLNSPLSNYFGKWDVTWYDEETNDLYHYSYESDIYLNSGIKEKLSNGVRTLFERNNDKGVIYSNELSQEEEINPPVNKHFLNIRRDKKHYPYLEKIASWVSEVHSLKFGRIYAPTYMGDVFFDRENLPRIKDKDFSKILGDLNKELVGKIIEDLNLLGFPVEHLAVERQGEKNFLFVKERGLNFQLRHYQLSQGMFRSLSLLIFIHYLIEKEHAQLIIIDDLCEGLDYDRATRLGKILFSRMKEKEVQFIATSNDSFLMNVVDIEYWNVIHREGNTIKSANYKNSREKFEEFKTTGLNNFDLFSSNFLIKA